MEYSDKFTGKIGETSLRNSGFHGRCQRCGDESPYTICLSCLSSGNKAKVTATLGPNIFEGMVKTVTVSGCNVLVNGVVYCTRPDHMNAQVMAKALQRRFASNNIAVRNIMKGIRR